MQPDPTNIGWEIWLDNQLSSAFAKILQIEVNMVVRSSYALKNKNQNDKEIFLEAKQRGFVIILTKDADFAILVTQFGSPPKIVKLNTGNMPTMLLWKKFGKNIKSAIKILKRTKTEVVFIE